MNLALLSTTEDKIEAAKYNFALSDINLDICFCRYFEVKSDSKENAILLYHRVRGRERGRRKRRRRRRKRVWKRRRGREGKGIEKRGRRGKVKERMEDHFDT